jgi:nucleotide-binding universal stress UspA family protein
MITFPSTVLLATDGSEDALLARRAVADLAVATGATVHVVGAWNLAVATYVPGYAVSDDVLRGLEEDARAVVEADRQALAGAGVRSVESHVAFGRPADVILDVADEVDADLTVLGSRGHGVVARLVLGSVSEEVVLAGHRPVLVMRGGHAAWPPPRVIAGCDGSRESLAVARIAAALARSAGAPLVLLDVAPGVGEGEVPRRRLTFGEVIEGRRGRLERWAERLTVPGGPPVRGSVTSGEPAAALIGAAGEAPPGAVAVGRRGIGRIRYALLGSVSTKVLHGATGPVLVAPWSPSRGR